MLSTLQLQFSHAQHYLLLDIHFCLEQKGVVILTSVRTRPASVVTYSKNVMFSPKICILKIVLMVHYHEIGRIVMTISLTHVPSAGQIPPI